MLYYMPDEIMLENNAGKQLKNVTISRYCSAHLVANNKIANYNYYSLQLEQKRLHFIIR